MAGHSTETKYRDPVYPDAKTTDSFQDGLEFQDFVVDLLCERLGIVISNYHSRKFQFSRGENRQGIEIKLDREIGRTGNVSIEIAEKTAVASPHSWSPSGIYRGDGSWLYIQGNYNIVFIFATSILRLLHKTGRYREHEEPTVKGFLLSVDEARRYAAKVIEVNEKERIR